MSKNEDWSLDVLKRQVPVYEAYLTFMYFYEDYISMRQ